MRAMTSGNEAILQALRSVNDPELGMNIVDLGLVYRAELLPDRIEVAITLTSPACPLGELVLTEARAALERSFPNGPPIQVELVWEPPWTAERMSEAARLLLG